ncbi:hypothetical protein L195_g014467, partial [Trifolium pratense]
EKKKAYQKQCDYSKGDWIKDTKGPLYNDTTCSLMKEGRNCIKHGRPDSDYLYWRWKPNECYLPRKSLRTSLNSIIDRRGHKGKNGIDVVVTTFTPHHFEGAWDKAGACPKTKPYRSEEKKVEGMDNEMRKVEVEEVENAKNKGNEFGRFRFEVLDITNLALLRPDGHPGPYMNPFPFFNGVQEYVQNDCVHWCLPGPIDTWNEIFLELIKKWEEQPRIDLSI